MKLTGRGRLIAGAGVAGAVAVATAIAAMPAQAAEGQILLAGSENAVADSYIVVLKDSAVDGVRSASVAAEASSLSAKYGAQVDGEELKAYVKANLARFKVPRDVVFVDELPRNATGKLLRNKLG